MDGELDTSPDVQILADDDVHSGSDDHDREDDDDGLEIKPPQQHGSKKDRHRHKHKEDRKKMRVRERPREEKVKMKDRDKQGRPVARAPPAREPVREPVRDVAYVGDIPREDVEARRREKSIKERERLENLERERHRLERERSKREQQHREKMRRDKERQRAQERAQRKREAARRAAPPAQSAQEKRSEKRYERSKAPPEHARSRSRSPLVQRRSGREEKLRQREYSHERSRSRQQSPREPVSRSVHEDFESDMAEGPKEPPAPRRPRPPHTPEGPPPPDDNDQASASGQSGSETDESGDSESDSHSSSGSEHRDDEQERRQSGHKSHEKLRSKFDNSDHESEGHSVHHSDEEQDEYVVHTPPSSPPILLPDLPPYYPAIQGCRNVEEFNCLNRIEEGTYGVVFRALDKKTKEIVALKKLKMEKEKEGFPITSLREINTLLKSQHINIVTVREIVVGSNMDKIYIVMDYVEHDLKSLMETMKDRFVTGEVKTLMMQLLRGVAHLHDNWIIHRDLKTSNLLLSHKGILKIGDFGLAREYGSPLKQYTPIVVTLWYRSPELLLGTKEYSTAVDMWSVGCIFAEFLTSKPLFPGKSDIDQLNRIFKELGTPSEKIWPGVGELPAMKKCTFADHPYNQLRNRFGSTLTDKGFDLLNRFLTYNPERRIPAEDALGHEYFGELPLPIDPSYFPTWPAKSEQPRKGASSPKPPSGGKAFSKLLGDDDSITGFHLRGSSKTAPEFALKF